MKLMILGVFLIGTVITEQDGYHYQKPATPFLEGSQISKHNKPPNRGYLPVPQFQKLENIPEESLGYSSNEVSQETNENQPENASREDGSTTSSEETEEVEGNGEDTNNSDEGYYSQNEDQEYYGPAFFGAHNIQGYQYQNPYSLPIEQQQFGGYNYQRPSVMYVPSPPQHYVKIIYVKDKPTTSTPLSSTTVDSSSVSTTSVVQTTPVVSTTEEITTPALTTERGTTQIITTTEVGTSAPEMTTSQELTTILTNIGSTTSQESTTIQEGTTPALEPSNTEGLPTTVVPITTTAKSENETPTTEVIVTTSLESTTPEGTTSSIATNQSSATEQFSTTEVSTTTSNPTIPLSTSTVPSSTTKATRPNNKRKYLPPKKPSNKYVPAKGQKYAPSKKRPKQNDIKQVLTNSRGSSYKIVQANKAKAEGNQGFVQSSQYFSSNNNGVVQSLSTQVNDLLAPQSGRVRNGNSKNIASYNKATVEENNVQLMSGEEIRSSDYSKNQALSKLASRKNKKVLKDPSVDNINVEEQIGTRASNGKFTRDNNQFLYNPGANDVSDNTLTDSKFNIISNDITSNVVVGIDNQLLPPLPTYQNYQSNLIPVQYQEVGFKPIASPQLIKTVSAQPIFVPTYNPLYFQRNIFHLRQGEPKISDQILMGNFPEIPTPSTTEDPNQNNPTPIPIIRYENQLNEDGSFKYLYETGNGILVEQEGQIKIENMKSIPQVKGSYSFIAPDGKKYVVMYTADEHGFRATGDHLPRPLPIPKELMESLDQNVPLMMTTKIMDTSLENQEDMIQQSSNTIQHVVIMKADQIRQYLH